MRLPHLDRPLPKTSGLWFRLSYVFLSFLFLACANLPQVQAQDLVVQRAWLEDTSEQMDWEAVQKAAMQPLEGVINRGFSSAPLWLRIRIDPARGSHLGAADETLVLRIRPAYLDRIEVFDSLTGGQIGILGDRQHPSLESMQGLDFLLPIARGTEARYLWLKLSSSSTRQIYAEVLSLEELSRSQLRQSMLVSLYLGISLILLIWGWVAGRLQHEKVLSYFGLMQLGSVLFGLSSLGVLHLLWPHWLEADWLDAAGSGFVIFAVVTGIWFHLTFLRIFQPAPWAMSMLWALFVMALFNLTLLILGNVRPALQNNVMLAAAASLVTFVASLSTNVWKLTQAEAAGLARPGFSKFWLIGLYSVLLVLLLITTTTSLGWFKANDWAMYASQIQGMMTSLLLLMLLQYRAYALNQQRQQALLALESSRLQIQHEQAAREEQEKLLMMLAHEIKTPLATMHMRLDPEGQGSAAIRAAMRDMNEVIERCTQAQRLGDGKLVVNLQDFDLVELVCNSVASAIHPERIKLNVLATLRVFADPQLMFICVNNLLENACKYAPSEAHIDLECILLPKQGLARLRISNPPGKAGWPDADKLFEKYYRAPKAQRVSGTGLGLYLVRNLIHLQGGEVHYLPEEGQICFALDIPLHI